MNGKISVNDLRRKVSDFRDRRGWLKYHTPKNLAISIAIETAELLEHFQWQTDEEIANQLKLDRKRADVSDELADVMIYCLSLSDILHIDLAGAINHKIRKNAGKY